MSRTTILAGRYNNNVESWWKRSRGEKHANALSNKRNAVIVGNFGRRDGESGKVGLVWLGYEEGIMDIIL